jgi:hypothetical protein
VDDIGSGGDEGQTLAYGTTIGKLTVNAVRANPVAFGPDILLAYATAGSVGPNTLVNFGVDAASRYGSASLRYDFEMLLAPEFGTFTPAERWNNSGEFTWKSPSSGMFGGACVWTPVDIGVRKTVYMLVTITDEPAVSHGVPAVNYVVIPLDVDCSK